MQRIRGFDDYVYKLTSHYVGARRWRYVGSLYPQKSIKSPVTKRPRPLHVQESVLPSGTA